ncbi:MAG TPA: hypothetical protein PK129_15675 [Cellvibrionaceae bacterium]|nr:hypothetical protein [Cellvibrionaceae bacterium]
MTVQPLSYKLFRWLLLALTGAWLLFQAPFLPVRASLVVFVNPAGSQEYSVKQSLSSSTFEEWLLKASLKAETDTRNRMVESLARLRRGKLLSVKHIEGPRWEVVWTDSEPRVLGLFLQASRDYLDAGPSPRTEAVKKQDNDVEKYERKLARNLMSEESGAPAADLDYVNPMDYAAALRDQRKMNWKLAQSALRKELHLPTIRTLEVRPVPRTLATWFYGLLVLTWFGVLAWLLVSRRRA